MCSEFKTSLFEEPLIIDYTALLKEARDFSPELKNAIEGVINEKIGNIARRKNIIISSSWLYEIEDRLNHDNPATINSDLRKIILKLLIKITNSNLGVSSDNKELKLLLHNLTLEDNNADLIEKGAHPALVGQYGDGHQEIKEILGTNPYIKNHGRGKEDDIGHIYRTKGSRRVNGNSSKQVITDPNQEWLKTHEREKEKAEDELRKLRFG
ncbi:MAG: hypothetical protein WCK11_00340 [Candidatus Falkowbacteria bacterium]